MDSVNSDDQRLFTESLYNLYVYFMAVMMFVFSLIKHKVGPVPRMLIWIAGILFFINVSAAWCAMESAPEVPYRHPVAFNTIFYGTMISAPGFLLYGMNNVHEALLSADELLIQYFVEP